jgi:hypothetical protein
VTPDVSDTRIVSVDHPSGLPSHCQHVLLKVGPWRPPWPQYSASNSMQCVRRVLASRCANVVFPEQLVPTTTTDEIHRRTVCT